MHASRRWAVVALGTIVLIGTPIVVRALPADDTDVTASTLLARAQASGPVPYSGYVESAGTLQLPVTDQFSDLAGLLGQRSRLRVWWRSADDMWQARQILLCSGGWQLYGPATSSRRQGSCRRALVCLSRPATNRAPRSLLPSWARFP